jgi:hypothetical protein
MPPKPIRRNNVFFLTNIAIETADFSGRNGERVMKRLFLAIAVALTAALASGCAVNVAPLSHYAPPSAQVGTSEFYTDKTSIERVRQTISNLGWLHQTGPGLTFTGQADDPSRYADCGQILRKEGGAAIPYASARSEFAGDDSANELKTSLDVVLKVTSFGSAIIVKSDYTLNREFIERRTIFGVESRPPESNMPIKFDTVNPGRGSDGVMCRSKLTLEQSVLE